MTKPKTYGSNLTSFGLGIKFLCQLCKFLVPPPSAPHTHRSLSTVLAPSCAILPAKSGGGLLFYFKISVYITSGSFLCFSQDLWWALSFVNLKVKRTSEKAAQMVQINILVGFLPYISYQVWGEGTGMYRSSSMLPPGGKRLHGIPAPPGILALRVDWLPSSLMGSSAAPSLNTNMVNSGSGREQNTQISLSSVQMRIIGSHSHCVTSFIFYSFDFSTELRSLNEEISQKANAKDLPDSKDKPNSTKYICLDHHWWNSRDFEKSHCTHQLWHSPLPWPGTLRVCQG